MVEEIAVSDVRGLVVNGVRCDVVAKIGVELARNPRSNPGHDETITSDEFAIAVKCSRLLREMRASGYKPEVAKDAYKRKITQEAQRITEKRTSEILDGWQR